MKKYFLCLFMVFPVIAGLGQNMNCKFFISAKDLSEDMSSLSSQNDEILLLLYRIDSTAFLKQEAHIGYTFFEDSMEVDKEIVLNDPFGEFVIFLLEIDSDPDLKTIDLMIQDHYPEILDAYTSRDYNEIERYFGDQDVLGIKSFDIPDSGIIDFSFEGRHKLDRFSYVISLDCN